MSKRTSGKWELLTDFSVWSPSENELVCVCHSGAMSDADAAGARSATLSPRRAGHSTKMVGGNDRGAVMTKERTSNERFEIVGLTKAEVDRCMEVLCGGPMPWDRGYCFASSELFARPSQVIHIRPESEEPRHE